MPQRFYSVGFAALTLCLMTAAAIPAHAAPQQSSDRTTQISREEGDSGAATHDLLQRSHVEGHIAFIKAELGITPAQEQLWAPVAAAMREDVQKLRQADMDVDDSDHRPDTAIDYLQNRVRYANLRAEGEDRFLTAFLPLYANLSKQQKQAADELLIPNAPE